MANSSDTPKQSPEPKIEAKQDSATAKNNSSRNALLVVLGVAVLAAAFVGGIQAADNRREHITTRGFGMPMMQERGFHGRYEGSAQTENYITLSAKVTSVNGNDFVVDQNGSSKTVKTDSNTRFRGVGINGLKSGNQVVVSGTSNSDGSIQALSVSVGSTAVNTSAPGAPEAGATQSF